MNKGELIERLSGRLGDHKTSSAAVDAVLNEIEEAVSKGEKVNITGFGVFEKRDRAARTARNPRTGEPVKVKKTTVPAFRPGASFKTLVAGGASSGGSRPGARAQSGQIKQSGQMQSGQTKRQTAYASTSKRQTAYAQPSRRGSAYASGPKMGSAKASTSRGRHK
jgi:DNA-binding protein HU-beta